MELELLAESGHPEAVEFLATVFPGSRDTPFLDRELRHWKFYAPHPFAKQSRSYVFRDAEGLIAHCGFCPVEYCTPEGVKTSFALIDWAGAARCAGAGFLLFRALWPSADSYLCVGGSDDARKIARLIPKVRKLTEMAHFAYPLRPWGQLTAGPWTWKSSAKWARSWKWHLARKRPSLDAWKAVPVERLSDADTPLLVPATDGRYSPLRRTPELVNYWLACPAGRVRAWRLQHKGVAVGVLVLAFLHKEARIADLVISVPSAPLSEAYSLAIDLAAQNKETCELSAASSAPPAIQAMTDAGMIARGVSDVYLGDPRKTLPAELPVEVNLTSNDGFYQQGNQPYFQSF